MERRWPGFGRGENDNRPITRAAGATLAGVLTSDSQATEYRSTYLQIEPEQMPTERRARILVVDDEPSIRHMLERVLGAEGYEVVAMEDGAAGLTAASTAKGSFDLVITNNHMPH